MWFRKRKTDATDDTGIPVPPRKLIDAVGGGGPGTHKAVGQEFLKYSIELAGLKPDHAVLDVGCGCGRIATAMAGYLGPGGIYRGFDVMPKPIKWSQKNITKRFPAFEFCVADLHNEAYNPKGKAQAWEYVFPYDDKTFDFAILTSVFTHVLPKVLEHYLSEIVRVLRQGGRCLATFFLLNGDSRKLMASGAARFDFGHELDGCYVLNLKNPEAAVAYDEEHIRKLFCTHAVTIEEPVRYGSWSGREDHLSFQDTVIARKG